MASFYAGYIGHFDLICKIFLQSEQCKGLVWQISAPAFTRFQKIVQCECSLHGNTAIFISVDCQEYVE